MSEELNMEITYSRRYVPKQFEHQQYDIKISGNEEQLSEQLEEKRLKVAKYVQALEKIVSIAHEANELNKKIEEVEEENA